MQREQSIENQGSRHKGEQMTNGHRTRVLLADDQALFRRGINAVLNGEDDIEVVAEADSGESAIAQATDLVPDVVLMDVRMPGVGGINAARAIKSACPTTFILMLTMSDEEEDLYDAIKSGANGYLLKEVSVATVADAIRRVVAGDSFLSPTMASKLLSEFTSLSQREPSERQPVIAVLSERETEVLRLIASGHPNAKIAADLEIAETTVRNHIRNILEKLHLHDRVQTAMQVQESRLLGSNG